MSARLPSWFWMLVCVASFAGSALAWSLERPGKERPLRQPSVEVTAQSEPEVLTPTAQPSVPAEPAQVEATRAAPAQATFVAVLPADTGNATKVLRCVVRGRVTYVDAAATCSDGSPGKLTVLPR